MVSHRCKLMVKKELDLLEIHCKAVDLGVVDLSCDMASWQLDLLKKNLQKIGLELIDDKKRIMTEKVKTVIIQMVHYSNELPVKKYSDHISDKLGYNYNHLATLFNEVEGITIQQYIKLHKVEKVKEYISYNDLSLGQIANKLNYSSIAHMSSQFKKITGVSPLKYKTIKIKRKNLEDL